MTNVIVQASEEVSYDSLLRNKTLVDNRDQFSVQQINDLIDEIVEKKVWANLSILEVGFNDGRRLRELSDSHLYSQFTGLEVREEPVEDMVSLGFNCKLVRTEMFDEFFASGETFDIIYGFGVLHHMSDPYKSLESLIKLLKPGGVVVFYREHHKYDLMSHLYATIKGNWAYEKNTFKMKRRHFKKLLKKYTTTYHVTYDNNGLTVCFNRLNKIYCMLNLQKIPLLNGLTIYVKMDTKNDD